MTHDGLISVNEKMNRSTDSKFSKRTGGGGAKCKTKFQVNCQKAKQMRAINIDLNRPVF